ncbi:MAG: hypothetical protein BIFFINMI_03427 [Phycisphaerae bacterium]|nr:hypothetical protein [Phycisphaerae bacterium]
MRLNPAATLVIVLMSVGTAFGGPSLPTIQYDGAFYSPGPSADPGSYGGLSYYKNGSTQELYTCGSYSQLTAISVPTPVIPDATWSNVPTATTLMSPVSLATRTWDVVVRGGYVYYAGYASGGLTNGFARVNLDLTGETYMGRSQVDNLNGLCLAPAGFIQAAGLPAANDTMSISTYFSAPELYLNAPQNGTGLNTAGSAPGARLLRPSDYSNSANWNYGYASVQWVQPLGTSDWQDGFIVLGERNLGASTLSLAFLDPTEVAAARAADADGIFAFANSSIARFDLTAYLSPGNTNAAGVTGMAYDPVTGRLFISETSTTSGAGASDAVIHVFTIGTVPEPATLSILALGVAPLLARRRRRR